MVRDPVLWMLIGVPASGKSTWVANTFDHVDVHDDLYVASTDIIIESAAIFSGKTYNEVFKDIIKIAENQMYQGVSRAVSFNHNIIWDQTNLTKKSRKKKLVMIPDHYEKIAVVFPTPPKVMHDARLASRPGKTIPSHVIDSMIMNLEQPTLDEGFDEVRMI